MYCRNKNLSSESIKQEFLTALKEEFSNVKVGDPLDKNTQVGPIISKNNSTQYNLILIKVLKKALNYYMAVQVNQKD